MSKFYLVTYDLKFPGRDYGELTEAILRHSTRCFPIALSVWIVKTDEPVVFFRDKLLPYIDANDLLFVIEVDEDNWASYGIDVRAAAWLNGQAA